MTSPDTKGHDVQRFMILLRGVCGEWSSNKDSVQGSLEPKLQGW